MLLTSTLQSVPCVYYRARVKDTSGDSDTTVHDEERAIGFRIRDATGDVRVFPRSATWDVPARFDERASRNDGSPAGLRIRTGSPYQPAEPDREALIADLLTPDLPLDAASPLYGADRGSHQYVEARIEPGDTVTIVGRALPFGALADPSEADIGGGGVLPADDPEVVDEHRRGARGGDPADRPGARLGQRGDPRVRHRLARPRAGARPVGAPPGAGNTRHGVADREDVRHPAETTRHRRRTRHAAPGVVRRTGGRGRTGIAIRSSMGLLGALLAIGSAIVLAFTLTPGVGP